MDDIESIVSDGVTISTHTITTLLSTLDHGLVKGMGFPKPGEMCVEAAVCYALGLKHSDEPPCVSEVLRGLKISLNDKSWSSNEARANGLRRLAILQLGTKDPEIFDGVIFSQKLCIRLINTIVADAVEGVGLSKNASECRDASNIVEARNAASAASVASEAYAASAARCAASAANAASAARYAAGYAADAADAASAAYAADAASAAYAADYAAYAAGYAAGYAADAADAADAASAARCAASAASYAVNAAGYAAKVAGYAASYDSVLMKFAKIAEDILIEMNVPGVRFLSLIKD